MAFPLTLPGNFEESGLGVDMESFNENMQQQRERSELPRKMGTAPRDDGIYSQLGNTATEF